MLPLKITKIGRHSKTFKIIGRHSKTFENQAIKTGSAYKFVLTVKNCHMNNIKGWISL